MSKRKNKNKLYATFLPDDAEKYISVYWNYYLSIEKEYMNVYTKDPSQINKFEEVKLYLSIGSEIDVIFKTICQILNKGYNGDKITDHKAELQKSIDVGDWDDYHEEVFTIQGKSLKPWDNTQWWTDYNNVKHKRACLDLNNDLFINHANQANIFEALAALYILENQFFVFMKEYLIYEYDEINDCKSIVFK